MNKVILLCLVLFCSASAFGASSKEKVEREIAFAFQKSEWTNKEKTAFTLSIIGNTLDLASSVMSDSRCVERNPILGKSPSNASLIALKLFSIGFEYMLYNSPKFRYTETHWYGYTSAVLHTGVAISNFRNNCY